MGLGLNVLSVCMEERTEYMEFPHQEILNRKITGQSRYILDKIEVMSFIEHKKLSVTQLREVMTKAHRQYKQKEENVYIADDFIPLVIQDLVENFLLPNILPRL